MNRSILLITTLAVWSASLPAQEAARTDGSRYLDQFVDTSAKPGDDFYQYAVGKWIKENPIPARRALVGHRQGRSGGDLRPAAGAQRGGSRAPGGEGHQHAEDRRLLVFGHGYGGDRQAGHHAAAARVRSHRGHQGSPGLLDAAAHLQYLGAEPLFATYVFQDEKNSERLRAAPLPGRPRAAKPRLLFRHRRADQEHLRRVRRRTSAGCSSCSGTMRPARRPAPPP